MSLGICQTCKANEKSFLLAVFCFIGTKKGGEGSRKPAPEGSISGEKQTKFRNEENHPHKEKKKMWINVYLIIIHQPQTLVSGEV